MSHQHQNPRRLSRRPSFILVGKEEEVDQMSCFNVLGNMGIPILYIIAGATTLIGSICMAIITNYWAGTSPPTCFLYNETPSMFAIGDSYVFGSKLSTCYWVAYGGIASLVLLIACGILYVFHVKDDKDVTLITWGCMITMLLATVLLLAVACTFSQGFRITCMHISQNATNKKGKNCKELLDYRVQNYNFPVKTSAMVTASLANFWIATASCILICIFHIALIVRRINSYE